MVTTGVKKIRFAALAGLVAMSVASLPARAHHDHNIVAPLAAFIAFNALIHHRHHRHYGHADSGLHDGDVPVHHRGQVDSAETSDRSEPSFSRDLLVGQVACLEREGVQLVEAGARFLVAEDAVVCRCSRRFRRRRGRFRAGCEQRRCGQEADENRLWSHFWAV